MGAHYFCYPSLILFRSKHPGQPAVELLSPQGVREEVSSLHSSMLLVELEGREDMPGISQVLMVEDSKGEVQLEGQVLQLEGQV